MTLGLHESPSPQKSARALLASVLLSAGCTEQDLPPEDTMAHGSFAQSEEDSGGTGFGSSSESSGASAESDETGGSTDSAGTGGGTGSSGPKGEFHPEAQVDWYRILMQGEPRVDPYLPYVNIGQGESGDQRYLGRIMPFLDHRQEELIEECRLILRPCVDHPSAEGQATLFAVSGSWSTADNWQTIHDAIESGAITLDALAAIPHPSESDQPVEAPIDGDTCREWIQQSPPDGYSFLIAADHPDETTSLQVGTPACFENPSLPVLWFDLEQTG